MIRHVTALCACGVPDGSVAPRCRACPALAGSPTRAPAPPPAAPDTTALMTYSRWKKSTGTFGPTGRVVATVLLLVPLPVFVIAASVGIGLIGGGIYLLVVMPWALRDIWKQAAIPIQAPLPPSSASSGPRF
jgi:hypothetical protein